MGISLHRAFRCPPDGQISTFWLIAAAMTGGRPRVRAAPPPGARARRPPSHAPRQCSRLSTAAISPSSTANAPQGSGRRAVSASRRSSSGGCSPMPTRRRALPRPARTPRRRDRPRHRPAGARLRALRDVRRPGRARARCCRRPARRAAASPAPPATSSSAPRRTTARWPRLGAARAPRLRRRSIRRCRGGLRKALAASPKIAATPSSGANTPTRSAWRRAAPRGRPREHVLRALALDPGASEGARNGGQRRLEQGDYAAAARYWRSCSPAPRGSRASRAGGGDRARRCGSPLGLPTAPPRDMSVPHAPPPTPSTSSSSAAASPASPPRSAAAARRVGRSARSRATRRRGDRHAPARRRALRDRAQQRARHDAAHRCAARRDLGIARRARRSQRRRRDALHRARRQLVPLPMSPRAFLATRAFSLRAKLRLAARAVHRARAGRRRGIGRRVRSPPPRRRVPRLRDRPVRRRRLCGRSGALVAAGGIPAPARARAEIRQPHQGPDQGRTRAQAQRGDGEERRAAASRFATACRRSPMRSRAPSAASRPAFASSASSATPTAPGSSTGGATARRSCAARAPSSLAVPAPRPPALVRELAPAAAQALAAIEYAAVASVATAYRRADIAHPLAGFGFLVPRRRNSDDPGLALLEQHVRGPRAAGHRPADDVRRRTAQSGPAARSDDEIARDRRPRARGARRRAQRCRCGSRSRAGRARSRNTISAISSGCAARRGRARAARASLLRELPRRHLGRRLHQVGGCDCSGSRRLLEGSRR